MNKTDQDRFSRKAIAAQKRGDHQAWRKFTMASKGHPIFLRWAYQQEALADNIYDGEELEA